MKLSRRLGWRQPTRCRQTTSSSSSVHMAGKDNKSWKEFKMEGRMLHQVQIQFRKQNPQFKHKRENYQKMIFLWQPRQKKKAIIQEKFRVLETLKL